MNKNKKEGLTLHFMPFLEIAQLDSNERIKKLLNLILRGKVIVIQGRLKPEEETRLIGDTMVMVGTVKGFKGIELAVISPNPEERKAWDKFRSGIARLLVGQTDCLTIVGPASVIKDMKKDPSKLEVMMNR